MKILCLIRTFSLQKLRALENDRIQKSEEIHFFAIQWGSFKEPKKDTSEYLLTLKMYIFYENMGL